MGKNLDFGELKQKMWYLGFSGVWGRNKGDEVIGGIVQGYCVQVVGGEGFQVRNCSGLFFQGFSNVFFVIKNICRVLGLRYKFVYCFI